MFAHHCEPACQKTRLIADGHLTGQFQKLYRENTPDGEWCARVFADRVLQDFGLKFRMAGNPPATKADTLRRPPRCAPFTSCFSLSDSLRLSPHKASTASSPSLNAS